MPEYSQTGIDKKEKDFELFKKAEWDRDDLTYFYATAKYIKSKFNGCENRLFLMPEDFISFCSSLKNKGHPKSFHDYLQNFLQLYIDGPQWGFMSGYLGEKSVMRDWHDSYSKRKHSVDKTGESTPSDQKRTQTKPAVVAERKHILLLGIELSRLQPQMLEKVQSGFLTIESNDLQDFYRLPWIWHYGLGEMQEMKATLASELAVPEQDADSIMIGTVLKPASGISITPEIKGSEMRAVFEKLEGATFQLLGDFRMADLGKSSVKFYRMP